VSPRSWRRLATRLLAAVLVVPLLGVASAASAPLPRHGGDGDLVASAHADASGPTVLDEAVQTVRPDGPGARADSVATASATCDGCRARAVTVQVVRADRGWRWWVASDNVATAWAVCHDCSAQAVAVQVVLVSRPGALGVDNRALAVTAGCTRCTVDAVAYQLVVRPDAPGLDPGTLEHRLLSWARSQPGGTSPPPGARTTDRTHGSDLVGLESAVLDLVGGTVLRSHADRGPSR